MSLNLAVSEASSTDFSIRLDHTDDGVDIVVTTPNDEEISIGFLDEDGVLQLESLSDDEINELEESGLAFDEDGFLAVEQ